VEKLTKIILKIHLREILRVLGVFVVIFPFLLFLCVRDGRYNGLKSVGIPPLYGCPARRSGGMPKRIPPYQALTYQFE
jgi:hypothetical protein